MSAKSFNLFHRGVITLGGVLKHQMTDTLQVCGHGILWLHTCMLSTKFNLISRKDKVSTLYSIYLGLMSGVKNIKWLKLSAGFLGFVEQNLVGMQCVPNP